MASIIKLKRSSSAGAVPGSLQTGEIAVNLFDRRLYVGNSTGVTAVGGEEYKLTTQANNTVVELKLLGESVPTTNTVALHPGEGIDIVRNANGSITFSGEDASVSNKGIASFDTNDFGVTSGAVSLNDAVVKSVSSDSGSATPSSHGFTISGTANEVETSGTGSTITIGLPDDVTIGGQLNVTENAVVTGNASVGGTFGVTGVTTLSSDTTVTGQLNVGENVVVTGNTEVGAALNVTGLASLDGGIDMDGAFTVADTTGNISTSGTLNVDAGSTLNGLSVTTFTANGASIFNGTVNFNDTTTSTNKTSGSLIIDGGVGIAENLNMGGDLRVEGDATIDGNLTVEGAVTYISSSTVNVDDSMLKLSANNAGDTVDTGVYAKYVVTGNSAVQYTGYFRDAGDGVFKFFTGLDAEPTTTVNTADTGYALAQVDAIIDGGTY